MMSITLSKFGGVLKLSANWKCWMIILGSFLEIATVVQDITCPLCKEKYGNTNGKLQELEGPPLVVKFLKDLWIDDMLVQRTAFLVGHHHTYTNVGGVDYQILLEADYLVNADERQCSIEAIRDAFVDEDGKTFINYK